MSSPPTEARDPFVIALLRAEGAAALAAAIIVWGGEGGSWVLFPLVLLVPDVSMLGYLAGPRIGAISYNLAHNWVLALLLAVPGWWLEIGPLVLAGAVVAAHVGLDRLLGYGLKYPTAFTDTHLGRIGRGR